MFFCPGAKALSRLGFSLHASSAKLRWRPRRRPGDRRRLSAADAHRCRCRSRSLSSPRGRPLCVRHQGVTTVRRSGVAELVILLGAFIPCWQPGNYLETRFMDSCRVANHTAGTCRARTPLARLRRDQQLGHIAGLLGLEVGFLIANPSNAIVSLLRHRWAHSLRRSCFSCVNHYPS
jgi:hypothetical protein